jgi:hypothetical protein
MADAGGQKRETKAASQARSAITRHRDSQRNSIRGLHAFGANHPTRYFVFAGGLGGKGEVQRAIFPPRNLTV